MSSYNNPRQHQNRSWTTQTGSMYHPFSAPDGTATHPSTSQNTFAAQIQYTEGEMQEDPGVYEPEDSEMSDAHAIIPQANQQFRSMSSPVPGQYMQQSSAYPEMFHSTQAQVWPVARQGHAQNQVGTNAGPFIHQDRSPSPPPLGNQYNGDVTISGNARVIRGSLYSGSQPPKGMRRHQYNGKTFFSENNNAMLFDGDASIEALAGSDMLPNPNQFRHSQGTYTSEPGWAPRGMPPHGMPPRGSYTRNTHHGR